MKIILKKKYFSMEAFVLFVHFLFIGICAVIKSRFAYRHCVISIVTASLTMTHDDFHTNRSIGTSDEMNSTKKHGGTSKLARTSYAMAISSSCLRVLLVYIARIAKYFPLFIAWELGTLCLLVRPQDYLYITVYVFKM